MVESRRRKRKGQGRRGSARFDRDASTQTKKLTYDGDGEVEDLQDTCSVDQEVRFNPSSSASATTLLTVVESCGTNEMKG